MKSLERAIVYVLCALCVPVGGFVVANRVLSSENQAHINAIRESNREIQVNLRRVEDKVDSVLREVKR